MCSSLRTRYPCARIASIRGFATAFSSKSLAAIWRRSDCHRRRFGPEFCQRSTCYSTEVRHCTNAETQAYGLCGRGLTLRCFKLGRCNSTRCDSGSTKSVIFSSARAAKRFPSSRCASATKIVRPERIFLATRCRMREVMSPAVLAQKLTTKSGCGSAW
jgi:hypothetical protein